VPRTTFVAKLKAAYTGVVAAVAIAGR